MERTSVRHKLTQTEANGEYFAMSQSDACESTISPTNSDGHHIDSRNTGDSESDCDVLTDLQGFASIFNDLEEKT